MNRKPFSHQDHAASDPISRTTAVAFLTQIEPKFSLHTPLDEQKEEYKKWDFTIHYGNTPLTVETEQKRVWKSTDGTFPYQDIDVPTRKNKSQADIYIMFNAEFNALAMIEMKAIINAPTITKSTKRSTGEYITQGETFFHIPVDQFRFYAMSEGVWERV